MAKINIKINGKRTKYDIPKYIATFIVSNFKIDQKHIGKFIQDIIIADNKIDITYGIKYAIDELLFYFIQQVYLNYTETEHYRQKQKKLIQNTLKDTEEQIKALNKAYKHEYNTITKKLKLLKGYTNEIFISGLQTYEEVKKREKYLDKLKEEAQNITQYIHYLEKILPKLEKASKETEKQLKKEETK